MPSLAEMASHAVMLGLLFTGLRYLRDTQPDPNPAIEAREAAKLAASTQPCAAVQDAPLDASHERREQHLPFVGTDRRISHLAEDAAAWRRSA
jgi:hypothetical protein